MVNYKDGKEQISLKHFFFVRKKGNIHKPKRHEKT